MTERNREIFFIDRGILRTIAQLMIAETLLSRTKHKKLHDAIKLALTEIKEVGKLYDKYKNELIQTEKGKGP